jgi:phospholipid/cholesterol/gamma-HCH transport system substrate-binding protein
MPSASRVRWAKFRVSVVSAVGLMILFTLFYLLTGGTLLEPKATIYLYVPDATGLDKNSPVRVDGIEVGKVSNVEFSGQTDPTRVVRISMAVEKDRLNSITDDSIAEISSESLIGDKYVDITSQKSIVPVRPNGEIHAKPPSELMKSLDLPQFQAQLRTIDALLTDIEGGKSTVGQFVLGNQIYNDLKASIGKIESAFHAAVTSSTAVETLYKDTLYNQITGPMANLDQALARLQSGQGTGGQMLHDTAQYESAMKTIQDLRASIADVQKGIWLQSDEAYQDWNRMLVSWIQQVDKLNADPMLNSTALYESLLGSAAQTRDSVKDFRENPRKYLRLKVW